MWASNTATTAMMAPIAMSILEALHNLRQTRDPHTPPDLRSWPFATALMLMVAYAASIGGIGTPVGSPPNLICIRQLRAALPDADLSFFRWMLVMVPLLTVMYGTLFGLLRWSAPQAPPTTAVAGEFRQYLRRQRDELGCWTASQVNTLAAFGVAVVLWIFPGLLALVLGADHPAVEWCGRRVPEAVVALLAALLLFVLPTDLRAGRFTIGWDDAVQIDWGTILLFGGGLSLGTLMFQTGVAKALGDALIQGIGIRSLWGLTALAVGLGILLSETSSNTASASMLIPVVIALAKSAEVHPVPPALGACLGASFGFMLPVSTPPNAIVYSSGLVPIGKMMRAGVMFDLCGYVIILGGLRVLCPLLGLA
jgi:sodium-dependent dicarboxylate transporter 2/3/5